MCVVAVWWFTMWVLLWVLVFALRAFGLIYLVLQRELNFSSTQNFAPRTTFRFWGLFELAKTQIWQLATVSCSAKVLFGITSW